MKINLGQYFTDLAEGLQIVSTIEVDEAQMVPGSTNTFPCSIQLGTKNGKAIHLRGVTLEVDA